MAQPTRSGGYLSSRPAAQASDLLTPWKWREPVPPHPCPLPKGEGAMPSVSADTCTPRVIAQPMLLPLPKGEGWGEGKETPGLEWSPGIFHGAP